MLSQCVAPRRPLPSPLGKVDERKRGRMRKNGCHPERGRSPSGRIPYSCHRIPTTGHCEPARTLVWQSPPTIHRTLAPPHKCGGEQIEKAKLPQSKIRDFCQPPLKSGGQGRLRRQYFGRIRTCGATEAAARLPAGTCWSGRGTGRWRWRRRRHRASAWSADAAAAWSCPASDAWWRCRSPPRPA